MDSLLALAGLINDLDLSSSTSRLNENMLDRYYRAAAGRVVFNPIGGNELKSHFSLEIIQRAVERWANERAIEAYSYAKRLVQIDALRAARFEARTALNCALDSFLAKNGESYTGFKFRLEKLQRVLGLPSTLLNQAWQLQRTYEPVEDYLREVALICEKLGLRIDSQQNTECCRHPLAPVFPLNGEHYAIQGGSIVYRLSSEALFVWSRLDGITSDEDVARLYCEQFDVDITTGKRETLRFLNEMTARGLVSSPYAKGLNGES